MSNIGYSTQFENYSETIVSGLGNLMQLQHLVDTTIMCNTYSLKVHKVVLAASSPYFHETLKNRPGELLIILKLNFDVLKSLVEYIYSGKTNITENNVNEFIAAARFLQIRGLSNMKEQTGELPEFSPPEIFNQPYGFTQDNYQITDEKFLQEDKYFGDSKKNTPNNVVLKIPIEINSHRNEMVPNNSMKVRNKYRHHYDCYNDINKSRNHRRRSHVKQDPNNSLETRLLNKAARKVLRKEERSSIQTIQQIKKLHGNQLEHSVDGFDLLDPEDNVLSSDILDSQCNQYNVIENDEKHTNNMSSENQYQNSNNCWSHENPTTRKTPEVTSTLSEYVDILKSTGLPTDIPILFQLEDGSYVNISEEILLDMVQSNSVQYEVVEPTGVTEQILQNGHTKSIDQFSEEISVISQTNLESLLNENGDKSSNVQPSNTFQVYQNNLPYKNQDEHLSTECNNFISSDTESHNFQTKIETICYKDNFENLHMYNEFVEGIKDYALNSDVYNKNNSSMQVDEYETVKNSLILDGSDYIKENELPDSLHNECERKYNENSCDPLSSMTDNTALQTEYLQNCHSTNEMLPATGGNMPIIYNDESNQDETELSMETTADNIENNQNFSSFTEIHQTSDLYIEQDEYQQYTKGDSFMDVEYDDDLNQNIDFQNIEGDIDSQETPNGFEEQNDLKNENSIEINHNYTDQNEDNSEINHSDN